MTHSFGTFLQSISKILISLQLEIYVVCNALVTHFPLGAVHILRDTHRGRSHIISSCYRGGVGGSSKLSCITVPRKGGPPNITYRRKRGNRGLNIQFKNSIKSISKLLQSS